MNWLTFIVILVFVLCFLMGMKKGLIKMIYALGGFIIGLLLAAILNPITSSFLHSNNSIYQSVYEAVEKNVSLDGKIKTLQQENHAIDELPLPKILRKKLKENNNAEVYETMAVDTFKTYVYKYITNLILNGISYISVYIVIMIILFVLSETLDLISKLPVLKELNQLAGGVVGLLQALLLFWVFCAILTVFSNALWARRLYEMINESFILTALYNGNFLLKIITSLKW